MAFSRGKIKRDTGASYDAPFRVISECADKLLLFVLLGSICLFILYPIVCIIMRSFEDGDGFSLAAYREVWQRYGTSLWNSLWTGCVTAVLCTVLSVATALTISTSRGIVKTLLMGVILITMVSPPFVSSLAYIQLYGRRGWITYRLLGLSWDPYNCWGIIFTQSISFVPMNALFLCGILEKIDTASLYSARDLGAKQGAILRDVVLPLIRPGILVTLLLCFIRSIADFGTPTIVGGRFATLASEIYIQLIGYSNLERASAMNVMLMIPAVGAFFLYRHLLQKSDALNSSRGKQGSLDIKLSRCGAAGIGAAVISTVFFIMMVLQYVCIFLLGFLKSKKGVYSFTLQHLEKLLRYDGTMMIRSVVYALIVALAGTLFAMFFAYYTDRRRVPLRRFFDCVATFPYMIPGTCFGIGYILAFNHEPMKLTGTAIIVILNMLFKQLPTTTKLCSAALTQIPRSLEWSARDLGGSKLTVLKDVILPGMRPAFLSCFAYNFSSGMTTAGAILFLINPGKKLAVFKLFDSVYKGEYAEASLIATVIIVIVLAVEGLAWLLSRQMSKKGGKINVSGTPSPEKAI